MMKCPKCKKKMVLKSKDFSFNDKPFRKYLRIIHWCEKDDIWLKIEEPVNENLNKGDIFKSAGIIIKNRKLLVEKDFDKDFYISPGGKLETGETPQQALARELKEEFGIKVLEKDLEFFGEFHAPASGQEERIVHMNVFLVKAFKGKIKHGEKVESIKWLISKLPKNIKVGSIFEHEVIPRLKEQGLID